MLKYLIILTFAVTIVSSSETWATRASLKDHVQYWGTLMQELVNELEKREWCNLKLNDITQTIDDNLYNMRVTGSVKYTNGFVVSIQNIKVVDIEQIVTSVTFNEEQFIRATVRGNLNFIDMLVGYDVFANLSSPAGEYRSTGTFLHPIVQIRMDLTRNFITKDMTAISFMNHISDGPRMHYMPSSNVTEALGRRFSSSVGASAANWASDIFIPIILDIARTKIDFPKVCFNNCS